MRRYRATLSNSRFRRLWIGATASFVGDGMSWVALIWLVYDGTGSPELTGALLFAYGAPVVVGGLLAGPVLDRFGPRRVLLWDSVLRGVVMAAIPVLAALGAFAVWHAFVVAAVYGLLKMVPLAGVASLIAEYVPPEQRTTANALENLSFSLGLSIAPAAAGLLVGVIGAEYVVALDALTFFFFAALLRDGGAPGRAAAGAPRAVPLRDALAFIARQPQIRATTLMFAAYNVGLGALFVLLAVYAREVAGAGSGAFGLLVAASFAGMLAGSLVVGAVEWRLPLGRSLAAAQLASGLAIALFALTPPLGVAVVALVLHGLFMSPLTIWAQTIRMTHIPAHLRGRVFALIRTTIQTTEPIGAALGGLVVGAIGVASASVLVAVVKSAPGGAGLVARDLAESQPADGEEGALPERATP